MSALGVGRDAQGANLTDYLLADSIDMLDRNNKAARHAAIYSSLLHSLRQSKQLPAVFPALYVAMAILGRPGTLLFCANAGIFTFF